MDFTPYTIPSSTHINHIQSFFSLLPFHSTNSSQCKHTYTSPVLVFITKHSLHCLLHLGQGIDVLSLHNSTSPSPQENPSIVPSISASLSFAICISTLGVSGKLPSGCDNFLTPIFCHILYMWSVPVCLTTI